MKVVDEGRNLLSGQAQGSSGLNKNPIKAEAEVREQSSVEIVENFLRPSSPFLQIAPHISFVFFCYHLSY